MAAGKPRFVVADPSLYDEQGHHLYLARHVPHAARLLGLDVVWWTHRHFVPEPILLVVRSLHQWHVFGAGWRFMTSASLRERSARIR